MASGYLLIVGHCGIGTAVQVMRSNNRARARAVKRCRGRKVWQQRVAGKVMGLPGGRGSPIERLDVVRWRARPGLCGRPAGWPARRTREPPASAAPSFGLTRREAEVLVLVAAGRTNRQIGQELFITEKTASVHVSRILTKLGVAGRGEAAAVAHRLGLDKR
jgi:DNA-binding NarL/FixJ family response regulator